MLNVSDWDLSLFGVQRRVSSIIYFPIPLGQSLPNKDHREGSWMTIRGSRNELALMLQGHARSFFFFVIYGELCKFWLCMTDNLI